MWGFFFFLINLQWALFLSLWLRPVGSRSKRQKVKALKDVWAQPQRQYKESGYGGGAQGRASAPQATDQEFSWHLIGELFQAGPPGWRSPSKPRTPFKDCIPWLAIPQFLPRRASADIAASLTWSHINSRTTQWYIHVHLAEPNSSRIKNKNLRHRTSWMKTKAALVPAIVTSSQQV